MGTYTLEDQATSKKTFGENLSIIMHERHISQAKMARELNIPKTTISTWMNDRRIPRSSAIALLCRYLQCTRKDLLDGPEETVPVKAIPADSSVSDNTGDETETSNLSPEAIKIAEQIDKNESLRLLFSVAVGSTPEDIKLAMDILWRIKHVMQNS